MGEVSENIQNRSARLLEFERILDLLIEGAKTELGKKLVRSLAPLPSLELAQLAQAETENALQYLLAKGNLPFEGISDITTATLRAVRGAQLNCAELLRIGAFLRGVVRLKSCGQDSEVAQEDSLLVSRLSSLVALRPLLTQIELAIIGEDEVSDNASTELAQIRRKIARANEDIRQKLSQILKSKSDALQDNLITVRSGRFVLPVKAERKGEIKGLIHDTSQSGSTLFIEPMVVVELNNRIRELQGEEYGEIKRILDALSAQVAAERDSLILNVSVVGELDFAQAKARLAVDLKAVKANLNGEGRIRVIKARHPLIEPHQVVPIDFELGYAFQTLVVTGPNTGGKTVSLKTCGLLTLMAMAGLFVPANDGAVLAWFEHVLADIGDEQSIAQSLSTFSSHLRQIIAILAVADASSLVLLDELGAGTDPSEGAALAIAILETLKERQVKIVATTHYKELKGYALNTDGVVNACCEFDTATLRPTYRLLIGVPGVSNALAISKRLGLPELIISRAMALITDENAEFEQLVAAISVSHQQTKTLEQDLINLRQQAEMAQREAEQDRQKIKLTKQRLMEEAHQEARAILKRAVSEAEQIIEAMHSETLRLKQGDMSMLQEQRNALRGKLDAIETSITKSTLTVAEGRKPTLEQIEIGAELEAPALGVTGLVVAMPDKQNKIRLQVGAKVIAVALDSVIWPTRKAKVQTESKGYRSRLTDDSSYSRNKGRSSDQLAFGYAQTAGSEIMLIGLTVVEALEKLERFLDISLLANINQVRIVHGKGSGALRQAVASTLKADKRIKEFRLGTQGEGESGVTIAEFTS